MHWFRKTLLLAALVLLGNVFLHAQSGGGLPTPTVNCICDLTAGDNSTGCYSTSHGVGHTPWSMSLVTRILRPAKDHFGMNLGQMIQVYRNCNCTITYLGDSTFRVRIGGGDVILVADDY